MNPNYKIIISKKYYPGINIYSNRDYINHTNDDKLKGLTLIQVPRHYVQDIYIDVLDDIVIYRVLCERNNNKKYKNWEKANFTLTIIGASCLHTNVVKKKFKKSVVKIQIGGPVAADPIFVDNLVKNKQKFQVYDKSYNFLQIEQAENGDR